jgi:hypothetical protein
VPSVIQGKMVEVSVAFQKRERSKGETPKETALQCPSDEQQRPDSTYPYRAAKVTRGDRLIISAIHTNCAPPPDLSVPVPEWTGQGRISVDHVYIPGHYSIKYVSCMCQGRVLGETQVSTFCLGLQLICCSCSSRFR